MSVKINANTCDQFFSVRIIKAIPYSQSLSPLAPSIQGSRLCPEISLIRLKREKNANCAPKLRLLQYHCTYPLSVGTVSQTSALYYRLRCRHSNAEAIDQSYFRGSCGTCLRHRSEQHLVFRRLPLPPAPMPTAFRSRSTSQSATVYGGENT